MPLAPRFHRHRDGVFNDRFPYFAFFRRGSWQAVTQRIGPQLGGHGLAHRRTAKVTGDERGQFPIRQCPAAEHLAKPLQDLPRDTCQGQFDGTTFDPMLSRDPIAGGGNTGTWKVTHPLWPRNYLGWRRARGHNGLVHWGSYAADGHAFLSGCKRGQS